MDAFHKDLKDQVEQVAFEYTKSVLGGDVKIEIDYEKFKADDKWDGLKGYFTNTRLSAKNVMQNYNQLWHIERAFRISKTDHVHH